MSDTNFNYYDANKAYGELYLQFPRVLLYSDKYSNLSDSAKIAYIIFRDRLKFSLKNNWIDESNNVFFIFTNKELCELLNKSEPTTIKIKKELVNAGLLLQKQMGFDPVEKKNFPNRLYLADLEVNATDIYLLQQMDENLATSGTKDSLARQGNSESPSNSGTKDSLARQKGAENPSNSGTKDSLVNQYSNTSYKEFKDSKDIKERSEFQNNKIENSFDSNRGNYDFEKQLIEQFIEDHHIEQNYGEWIVTNFKKYSYGDFDTFQVYYEKLYYAHKGAEEELGIQFMLDPYFTDRADTFKFELSKTFWRVIETSRAGKVKKDVNNLLFASFRNDFISFGKSIKYAQENKGKPNVPLINPFEEEDKE